MMSATGKKRCLLVVPIWPLLSGRACVILFTRHKSRWARSQRTTAQVTRGFWSGLAFPTSQPVIGDRFFYVRYAEWLYRIRYVMVVLAGVLFAVSIVLAGSLKTAQEVPKLFPIDSGIQRYIDYTGTGVGVSCAVS